MLLNHSCRFIGHRIMMSSVSCAFDMLSPLAARKFTVSPYNVTMTGKGLKDISQMSFVVLVVVSAGICFGNTVVSSPVIAS